MTAVRRGWAVVVALIVSLAVLGGCGGDDEPERPRLLSAGQVDGENTSTFGLLDVSALPCPAERETVLEGSDADDFKAYEREQDGVTETVVVGRWPMQAGIARLATQTLRDRIRSAECGEGDETWLVEPVGLSGEYQVGFQANDLTSPEEEVTRTRGYAWKNGWMTAVWLERADGSNPVDADLVRLSNAQLDKVPGEIGGAG